MDFQSGSTTPPHGSRRPRGGGGGEGEGVVGEEDRGVDEGGTKTAGRRWSSGSGSSNVPASSQHGRSLPDAATNTNTHTGVLATSGGGLAKGMSSVEGGSRILRRRTSKEDTPPSTPPPRPPPPRQPPSLQEMREKKERILQRMTSMPAYPRSEPRARADRHLSMNGGGKNLSFDQPYYRASSTEDRNRSTDLNPEEGEIQKELENVSSNMDRVHLRGEPGQNKPPIKPKPKPLAEVRPSPKNDTAQKRVSSERLANKPDQADVPNTTGDLKQNASKETTSNRAPKFTTTKRRSSTVDEMLFDDYVEPEIDHVDTKPFTPENLPQDLISFDQEASEKTSPGSKPKPEEGTSDDLQSPCSVDSSDAEYGDAAMPRSTSQMSDKSWSSNYSLDSQPDDVTVECMEFMKAFVDKVFNVDEETTQVEKAKFGELCQYSPGRLWFSRYVNSQRVNNKRVTEETFFRLVQYMAVCLFECGEAEDFSPAKTLMNMCFTFYCDLPSPTGDDKSFLYMFLKEQPIWQSLRFWNAAFFDAVQCERSRRPMATNSAANDTMTDDRNFQENITFGQLGTFTCNMRAFGLSRELCLEFLRKQSTIANLSKEQVKLLRENVEKMKE